MIRKPIFHPLRGEYRPRARFDSFDGRQDPDEGVVQYLPRARSRGQAVKGRKPRFAADRLDTRPDLLEERLILLTFRRAVEIACDHIGDLPVLRRMHPIHQFGDLTRAYCVRPAGLQMDIPNVQSKPVSELDGNFERSFFNERIRQGRSSKGMKFATQNWMS